MALDIRSFFIGIATVFAILAVGFGGGVLMGGMLTGGDTKVPSKVERQAAQETKPAPTIEAKPVNPPVIAATPAPVTPAQAQVSEPAPAPAAAPPAPPKPEPQPVRLAEPAPQPQMAPPPQPAPQPQVTTEMFRPALGPQKPVALNQPGIDERLSLSRREEARLRAYERREQRRVQREQQRKQMAERRRHDQMRQEQLRQEEAKAAQQQPRRQVVDDDDDEPPVARRGGFFGGGPFGLFNDSNSGCGAVRC